MARLTLFLAMVSLLPACAGDTPEVHSAAPAWVDLTLGLPPVPLVELALELEARVAPPRPGRLIERGLDGGETWFELPLPPALWTRDANNGTWSTPLPTGGALLACELDVLAVADGALDLRQGRPKPLAPGHFWRSGTTLWISVEEGQDLSARITLRQRLGAGEDVDGRRRVARADLACDGFLVFPGRPEVLVVDVAPGSLLSFASVSPDPLGSGERLGPTTFRVRLDGRLLLEHVQPFRRPVRSEWHRLELGASGRHELAFEVEGAAPALIATPRLRPSAIGRPGARPWAEERPDLVLVLCDTFRADNLAAWGGKPELAPALNRLVERSLHFLDARAVAAWTLPSIGTVLSGVFPGQHGATDMDRVLASGIETAAEVLARAGYRTVAVTDSGFFSRNFEQDQGFEWFEEVTLEHWDLRHTLERIRAQRAADDGRPLFLVLHTYRVHGPMRVGPEEDPRPARERRIALKRQFEERKAAGEELAPRDFLLESIEEGKEIYEDAVQDLDRKLGDWLTELEHEGFFEHGLLVLTSDHGNARGEHGQVGHGGSLYDVKLRVPLAIAGRGLAPRAVPGLVSLVDVAPTLVRAAGIEPPATWAGRSLLERDSTGPIFAFDLMHKHRQIALYAGDKKLMARDLDALRAGEATYAFDLARDRAEEANLVGLESWPEELARALADEVEPLVFPVAGESFRELSSELLEQLEDIGYTR